MQSKAKLERKLHKHLQGAIAFNLSDMAKRGLGPWDALLMLWKVLFIIICGGMAMATGMTGEETKPLYDKLCMTITEWIGEHTVVQTEETGKT